MEILACLSFHFVLITNDSLLEPSHKYLLEDDDAEPSDNVAVLYSLPI